MIWNAQLLPRNEIVPPTWDAFVEASPQRYLYYYSWYLDAVCPCWSAVVVTQKERWVAVLPLPIQQKRGFSYSFQPHLTQFLGIIFAAFEGERHSQYHFLKTATEAALDALPKNLLSLDFKLHPGVRFFLPFYWKKFEVLPRLTYWLSIEKSYAELAKTFSSSVSNHLKKAQKAGVFFVETEDESMLVALALVERIYNPEQAAIFLKIWEQVRQRQQGFILQATDPEGRLHSAAAFIRDGEQLIFFALVQDRSLRSFGANALLVTEGIRRCFQTEGIRWFDFEGSMLEPVEQYFRSFNPEAKVYFSVRKERFPWMMKAYRRLFLK